MQTNKAIDEEPDPYAYLDEDFSLEGWAWEFLRRDKKYQEEYEILKSDAKELEQRYGTDWKKKEEAKLYSPIKLPNETDDKWRRRVALSGGKAKREILGSEFKRKWCLVGVYAPDRPYDSSIKFVKEFDLPHMIKDFDEIENIIEVETEDGDYYLPISKAQGVFVFDLDFPIKPQLEKAGELLYQRQKELYGEDEQGLRKRDREWKRYLKVLDTYDANPDMQKKELGGLCGNKIGENAYSDAGYKNLLAAQRIQNMYKAMITGLYKVKKKPSHLKA